MLNSTVLEVAIGMVFSFASVALIASAVNEAIASVLGWRSKTLLTGVKDLLNDGKFSGLARDVYNHALVNPRSDGTAQTEAHLTSRPSYIDANNFALALVTCIQSVPGDFAALGNDIDGLPNPQLKRLLKGFYGQAVGDSAVLHRHLASWFDAAMNRVSGSYKRRSQWMCFLIGLVIAALFNLDAFHLFASLWAHPTLVTSLGTAPVAQAADAMDKLMILPIGWASFPPKADWGLLAQGVGWLVTASAALFGAPFWFDIMQQLLKINLRGTGKKPESPPAGH